MAKGTLKESESMTDEEAKPSELELVKVKKQCPRCKGQCTWVSSKTGYRAKTAAEPLTDPGRKCPECKGDGVAYVTMTKVAYEAEKAENAARKQRAKAKIEREANAKLKEVDES